MKIKSENNNSLFDRSNLVMLLLLFKISYINLQDPDKLLFLKLNLFIDLFLTIMFVMSIVIGWLRDI
jgi:hypothetical protein